MHTILVSGHLIDASNRSKPRFPQRAAKQVTDSIGATFDRWAVGAGWTVVCGAARGTDIIGAEQALARGARVVLCLALSPEAFKATSVSLPDTDWADRFDRLLTVAEVRQLPNGDPDDELVFARTNDWMVSLTRALDPEPYGLFVWDGQAADGPGGTADLIHKFGRPIDDPHIAVIQPSTG